MNIELLRAMVLVGLSAVAFGSGWQVHAWKSDSDEAARLQAQQDQERLARDLVAQVAQQTVQAIAGIKVTNTTIYQRTRQEILLEPMPADCRIPAGWMRQVNGARAGELRPEPAGALSGPAASAGR